MFHGEKIIFNFIAYSWMKYSILSHIFVQGYK